MKSIAKIDGPEAIDQLEVYFDGDWVVLEQRSDRINLDRHMLWELMAQFRRVIYRPDDLAEFGMAPKEDEPTGEER